MCDALGIPLFVIIDVPGYLPGVRQERESVVRRAAKPLHAFAESVADLAGQGQGFAGDDRWPAGNVLPPVHIAQVQQCTARRPGQPGSWRG
jgi:Carboxyl transferase domain